MTDQPCSPAVDAVEVPAVAWLTADGVVSTSWRELAAAWSLDGPDRGAQLVLGHETGERVRRLV